MNSHGQQYSSPVDLAFDRNYNDNNGKYNIAKVLPPFQDQNYGTRRNDEEEDLQKFRSKIIEMDNEIQDLKRIEREKLDNINQQIYHNSNYKPSSPSHQKQHKPIYKDESVSTHDLLEEQNKRISELQQQLLELKLQMTPREDAAEEIPSNNTKQYYKQNEQSSKSYDEDDIRQRIGDWSPKDPYSGPMNNLYFPFGSPGGGAPLRDTDGNIQTTVYGPQTIYRDPNEQKRKALASQVFQETMRKEMLQQKLKKLQDRQKIREPDNNLSDILSQLKVGRPRRDPETGILLNHHLPSSDVTNIHYVSPRAVSPERSDRQDLSNIKQDHGYDAGVYGLELAKAAREREMMKKLEKLREQQEVKQHNESWDHLWGTSGYGYQGSPPVRRSNHRNFYEMSFNSS